MGKSSETSNGTRKRRCCDDDHDDKTKHDWHSDDWDDDWDDDCCDDDNDDDAPQRLLGRALRLYELCHSSLYSSLLYTNAVSLCSDLTLAVAITNNVGEIHKDLHNCNNYDTINNRRRPRQRQRQREEHDEKQEHEKRTTRPKRCRRRQEEEEEEEPQSKRARSGEAHS